MKGLMTAFLAILFMATTVFAGEKGPKIHFLEKTHDFGVIKEANGPVSYEFEFENKGDEPLIIISVNASCGCTRPEYSDEPIKPGKKSKIKVTYNPAGRPGEFERKVKIRSNDEKKRIVLRVTGVVIPENQED